MCVRFRSPKKSSKVCLSRKVAQKVEGEIINGTERLRLFRVVDWFIQRPQKGEQIAFFAA